MGYGMAFLLGIITLLAFKPEEDKNYFEISKNLEIFSTLFRELNIYYVDDVKPGRLMKTGIDAMLKSLDPYTSYIPESKIEDYRFMTTGEYGGIGATISKRGEYVVISSPYEGFPAQKSGLRAGDKVIKVDGRSIKGKSTSEVSDILKGQAGTEVRVTINRPGVEEPREITIVREKVAVPSVPYAGMLNDTVGYIRLRSFTQTASEDVEAAFKDLRDQQDMKQLVLDLRGNGGGLLKEAVDIVNFFVPKGQEVVSTKGRLDRWDKTHKALNAPLDTNIRLAVLVDESSASASEIVSGAIQDLDRGVILGKRTFGKGLVQQTRDLYYNSKLKLTVAKYYIPSGRCIQEVDYTHHDEMESRDPENIPDSLIKTYETRNGRPVLDAHGIHPDVEIDKEEYSKLTQHLIGERVIFDHATWYRTQHDSIPAPGRFDLSDEVMSVFRDSVLEADFQYKTRTEEKLSELEKIARNEKYFSHAEEEFDALRNTLHADKAQDFNKFRDEIEEVLEQEILSRYYYQTGRIQASLSSDHFVDSALVALRPERYRKVLSGPAEGEKK